MKILPQAQISTGLPYGSFLRTSGERYPGVPANPVEPYYDLNTFNIENELISLIKSSTSNKISVK